MWIGGAPLYELLLLLLLLLIVVGLTIALRGVGRPSNRVATPGAGNFFFHDNKPLPLMPSRRAH